MRVRPLHVRMGLLITIFGAMLTAGLVGCVLPAPATPVPTYTPWVQVVTATFTPTAPPTAGPPPTPTPPPPTATLPPPPPSPTRTPPPPQPPVAQIIAPANGTRYFPGQVVAVQFTAGSQAGVARAGLYVNREQASYHTYSQHPTLIRNDTLQWTPSVAGNYTLQIVAYDAFNNPGYSDLRTIVVQQQAAPPSVRIDYPASPTDVQIRQFVQIQATIDGPVGIQRLELVERNKGTYTTDTTYHNVSYQWRISWQSAEVGEHRLFVRAWDTNGQTGQSGDLIIRVLDNQSPQVNVTYSATSLGVGSDLKAHVEAVDANGLARIALRVNDTAVDKWEAGGQTHVSVDLWWRDVGPAGTYNVNVRAIDAMNNRTETPIQPIHVQHSPPAPPHVVGQWVGEQFRLRITEQKENGKLKGTLRVENYEREPLKDSRIDGRNVTIHAHVHGTDYNLMLTVSNDGARLEGHWSTMQTGLLVPITLVKAKDL